ncbi:MAG: DoxX family protein [Acidobacteria bacterium]|nr:DoxX family protein [Acidobacteriota bacterium]
MSGRLDALQPAGVFLMRVVLGGIVLGYCVARFSGGMAAFTATVTSLGLPRWMAPVAAWVELLAALMLLIGIKGRLAAAVILAFMLVGIRLHFREGLGGYDAYLSQAAMALTLIFFGAGPWSVDSKVRPASGRRR